MTQTGKNEVGAEHLYSAGHEGLDPDTDYGRKRQGATI